MKADNMSGTIATMTSEVSNKGVVITPFFTDGKTNPLDYVMWEPRTATITNSKGEVIFEQRDVRVPEFWSQQATNIVASKYLYGKLNTAQRERGVDELIKRVVRMITLAGEEQGYFTTSAQTQVFSDELAYLLVHQMTAFNSPVWFNVGLPEGDSEARSWHWDPATGGIVYKATGYRNPQCSACFINGVDDSMEGIMELARTEAMLFKFGSGTGTNFSALRSSKEGVSGGGVASGPLSFMKGLDAFAGVIKSGGKTRRAAKMAILNADHPDIEEFIDCKLKEDRKAQALMREGYDGSSGPDSEAYSSIFYQNANNSVRASDEFMQWASAHDDRDSSGTLQNWKLRAVKDGSDVETVNAKSLLRKIAAATWACGDPGMQFDDIINKWHTCKTTGRINASNPCSEYMFLDDSACNLASLNLMKFVRNGEFWVEGFCRAVDIMILAQDILVDLSGYPTEKIARNSHDFRPLGLGYANLGALLMYFGLPYDSEEGRYLAAAITAVMTGEAYRKSAFIAYDMQKLTPAHSFPEVTCNGAFPGFATNMDSMLDVMKQHASEAKKLVESNTKTPYKSIAEKANLIWRQVLNAGEDYGFRNAQVTVLAPTGTIGFMMDCDTTGIEPELALVKYKRLVGGGVMKITNDGVADALRHLKYSADEVREIVAYINEEGTVEGSAIREKDLPVFDTAFRPEKGIRSINYMGHIRMMAAVQPFLSGAISKTVNMPNEATVEDIEQAYIESWKLQLKSVAIYRDGSKSNQVLVTKKENTTEQEPVEAQSVDNLDAPPRAVRHRLPDTRPALNHKFSIANHDGYINVGLYKNGQPGEIFITMAKEGSTISGFMDGFALALSIALQHGVPLEVLTSKMKGMRFEPSGWTCNPDIGYAKSIMDYLAKWMELQYLKPKQSALFPTTAPVDTDPASPAPTVDTSDAPPCPDCGNITVRNGSCYKCLECGSTTGCS